MIQCPSSEKLAGLLADRLGGAEAVAVEAHIEACSDCQLALERLTGRADTPVAAARGGTDFKSVLPSGESGRDFLRRLEQQLPSGEKESAAFSRRTFGCFVGARPLRLDFGPCRGSIGNNRQRLPAMWRTR